MSEIPEKGTFFLSKSCVDRNPKKACFSICAMLPNEDQNLVQMVCSPLNSYWRSESTMPFDICKAWAEAREITPMSAKDVEAFVHKDKLIKNVISNAASSLVQSGFKKFAIDERWAATNRPDDSCLKIAKLNTPLVIEGENGKSIKATHVTDIGELVTDIRQGLTTVSMYSLPTAKVEAALQHVNDHGFAASIEKKLLKETGASLSRNSESPSLGFN